jgi:hypothetical protein
LKKQIKNIFRIIDDRIGKFLFSVVSINDLSIELVVEKNEYLYENTKNNDLSIISDDSMKVQQLLDSRQYQKENSHHKAIVYKLSGAKFKIPKGGFVIFGNKKVLLESCNNEAIYFFRTFSKIALKIRLVFSKSTKVNHVYALEHNLDFNYWHLHAELIPQLGLIIKAYFNEAKEKISVVIRKDFPVAYRNMLLQLFGEYISLLENSNGIIKPDFIYVTSEMYNRTLQNSGNFIQFRNLAFWDSMNYFKSKLKINTISHLTCDVLLISRANASSRRLLNENDLVSVLSWNNIKVNVVSLEQYSWLDQLSILNSAKVVLALHGAHGASLLYSAPIVYLELVNLNRSRGIFVLMDQIDICIKTGTKHYIIDLYESSNQLEDYKISVNQQNEILNLIKDEIVKNNHF